MTYQYQLLPDLSTDEFTALKESIKQNGILVPIEKDEAGNILDGHHRLRAMAELKSEGVDIPWPVVNIRSGMDEQQKRNHVRALNIIRRHMSKDQLKAQWEAMRADNMTLEQIARTSNVGVNTVKRALDNSELPNGNSEITNKRGQNRPKKYKPKPPKTVITTSKKNEQSMFDALATVGADNVPDGISDAKKISTMAGEIEKENKRQEIIDQRLSDGVVLDGVDLRLGDLSILGAELEDSSIDLILTDPPYPAEFLPSWDALAALAVRVLKPSKFLVAYSGQLHLPDVMQKLSVPGLRYYWTICLIHNGGNQFIQARNVNCGWKPLLVFQKEPIEKIGFSDVIQGTGREKELHDWAQATEELNYVIEKLSIEGDVILDPFAGSGTTLVAAKRNNRRSIGFEIDEDKYKIAMGRLNGELQNA